MLWPSRRASRDFDNVMAGEILCENNRDIARGCQTATEAKNVSSEDAQRRVRPLAGSARPISFFACNDRRQ
jgi:hypothetical protein